MSEKATILYVDDEMLNLQIFEINFRKTYRVLTALSGEIALEILDLDPLITIVVSDMHMPGMNGIEFINKAREKHSNLAFFILTGYDITLEISKALENQLIHQYFRKPFNMREIQEAIELTGNNSTKPSS